MIGQVGKRMEKKISKLLEEDILVACRAKQWQDYTIKPSNGTFSIKLRLGQNSRLKDGDCVDIVPEDGTKLKMTRNLKYLNYEKHSKRLVVEISVINHSGDTIVLKNGAVFGTVTKK